MVAVHRCPERLEVGTNHRRHTICFRGLEQRVDGAGTLAQIVAQRFERDIESDVASIAEAIGDSLRGGRDSYGYAFKRTLHDAVRQRGSAGADDVQLGLGAFGRAGFAIDEDPHVVRELCGQSMHLKRAEKADRCLRVPRRDLGERRRLGEVSIRNAIDAARDTLERAAISKASKVRAGNALRTEIARSERSTGGEPEHDAHF